MPISEGDVLKPAGFEAHTKDCPQDPQEDYKRTNPLVRRSVQLGEKEPTIYEEQAAGMTPVKRGDTPPARQLGDR